MTRLDRPVFQFPRCKTLLSETSKPAVWPNQPPIQWPQRSFPRIKWPVLEADYSLPYSAKVMQWSAETDSGPSETVFRPLPSSRAYWLHIEGYAKFSGPGPPSGPPGPCNLYRLTSTVVGTVCEWVELYLCCSSLLPLHVQEKLYLFIYK